MKKVPDHNTLCQAFHALDLTRRSHKLLDVLARWFALARQLGRTAAIDSTLYDTQNRSRHYERRCRHYASSVGKVIAAVAAQHDLAIENPHTQTRRTPGIARAGRCAEGD